MSGITAFIESVEVVDAVQENGSFLDKGFAMIKSRISLMPAGQHAEYHITVCKDSDTITLPKRFSEFSELHLALKEKFGNALPVELPSKTMVRHFDPALLEDRKHALNAYLKELCRNKEIATSTEMTRFFDPEVPRSVPSMSVPTVSQIISKATGTGGAEEEAPAAVRPTQAKNFASGRHDDPDDDLLGWDR